MRFWLLLTNLLAIPDSFSPNNGIWCNGSTTDFESVSLSSNLGVPANFKIFEKTIDFPSSLWHNRVNKSKELS